MDKKTRSKKQYREMPTNTVTNHRGTRKFCPTRIITRISTLTPHLVHNSLLKDYITNEIIKFMI